MAESPTLPDRRSAHRAERAGRDDAQRAAKAARLFDIRRLIGGLFLIYGVILTVLGLGESDASIAKSADININLYAGLGMLDHERCFIAWALMRPLGRDARGLSVRAGAPAAPADHRWRRRARAAPGGNRASTAPPKPPPIMRAPAAPAALSRSTVASTSGTEAS